MQRPEEPSEWAGLPGEPLRPRSPAEMLPDDEPVDVASNALLGVGESHLSSIAIPVVPIDETPPPDDEARGSDPV